MTSITTPPQAIESQRILTFLSPSQKPEITGVNRLIYYRGNRIVLTEEQRDELCSKFPSYWHSEKDKIVHFTVTDDNVCFCEREKIVYNYATRNTEKKLYVFDGATTEQIIELKEIILAFYQNLHLKEVSDIQNKILDGINKLSFIKSDFLRMRDQFLQSSDYLMMPDYPLSDEERAQWTEYRQALRDITEQEAWVNEKYLDVVFPASPDLFGQVIPMINFYKNRGIDFTEYKFTKITDVENVKEFVNNFAIMTAKKGIIDSLVKLGLPSINKILYPNFPEFSDKQDLYMNGDIETITTQSLDILMKFDEYKNKLDEALQNVDVKMSIDDIIKTIQNSMEESTTVENLLQELISMEESTND